MKSIYSKVKQIVAKGLPSYFHHTATIKSKNLKLHSDLHSSLMDKTAPAPHGMVKQKRWFIHRIYEFDRRVGQILKHTLKLDSWFGSRLHYHWCYLTSPNPALQNTTEENHPKFCLKLPKQFRFWLSTMIHPGPRTSPWNPRDAEVCWRNLGMSFG